MMALPIAAAIGVLETLLPIAHGFVQKINMIKKENPEAWAQIRGDWEDAVEEWKALGDDPE